MDFHDTINSIKSIDEDNAFSSIFDLSLRVHEHWDASTGMPNDSGRTIDSLSTAISTGGQKRPVEVVFCYNEETGEIEGDQVFVFDGNHRLASM